ETLFNLLLRRTSPPVYWKEVRDAWIEQVRRLSTPRELARLAERMDQLLADRAGEERDLVWVAHEVVSWSLLPTILEGLGRRRAAPILRDLEIKIANNLDLSGPPTVGLRFASLWSQLRAGWIVRRELHARAKGRRPRRLDLTDPMVDMLPRLGAGRAVHAITGLFTAIAAPPGCAASALIYALHCYPEAGQRVRDELSALSLEELYPSPTTRAPETYRFVREVLRLWSPTPVVDRPVRKSIDHPGICLREGQAFMLSSDIQHHDPERWQNPDVFDPDRWNQASRTDEASRKAYVPFGWTPRPCIGAGLALGQLILFAHLLTTRYHVELATPDDIAMAQPSMPVPQNLRGTLRRVAT
ncbi:MAG: cytochrome P450, partial [Acidobacteria bacterium]|nr:cytochrome P450 [Acidobacteriota bacterium]